MGTVIALGNDKGGVAKTTTVGNLGAILADRGHRVLLVDADPQANLTSLFGVRDTPGARLEDLLETPHWPRAPHVVTARSHEDGAINQPLAGGVHLIPASPQLAELEAQLVAQPDGDLRLRELLIPLRAAYDVVLIDTPPGGRALSTIALVAADALIVPVRPADFDVDGAGALADRVDEGAYDANPALRLLGVLVTQTDPRWVLQRETTQALTASDLVPISVQIPFSVHVGRAPRYATPTALLDPGGRVARAYHQLADWLEHQLS